MESVNFKEPFRPLAEKHQKFAIINLSVAVQIRFINHLLDIIAV